MLAFWCGGDIEHLDRLFRQSALMRDKWERDDYRTATLTKAVTMCSEFYKPVGRSSAADDFSDLQQMLRELAPALMARMKPGACLVLSGLLDVQADAVEAAYAELGKARRVQSGDWVALVWGE